MSSVIAKVLRRLADRLDPQTQPTNVYVFTYNSGTVPAPTVWQSPTRSWF